MVSDVFLVVVGEVFYEVVVLYCEDYFVFVVDKSVVVFFGVFGYVSGDV